MTRDEKAAQQLDALAKANVVRLANKRLLTSIARADLVDGIDVVIGVLRADDPDAPIEGAPIHRLLEAPRRFGSKRVTRLQHAASIRNGDLKLREITRRQRLVLAAKLEHPELLWPSTDIPKQRAERELRRRALTNRKSEPLPTSVGST